jgi:hypothetical protein
MLLLMVAAVVVPLRVVCHLLVLAMALALVPVPVLVLALVLAITLWVQPHSQIVGRQAEA